MSDSTPDSPPDQNLKEQDKGIIEAFSKEDHSVLTNTEIAENVSLSKRQVRRRLDKLADKGVVGKRVVSGVKMAWLEEDVKEPITVQYPLLRFVRDRTSVQLFLIGSGAGIISVLILLASAVSIGYEIPTPLLSPEQLLIYGVISAVGSASFILVAVAIAIWERILGHYGINIEGGLSKFKDRLLAWKHGEE